MQLLVAILGSSALASTISGVFGLITSRKKTGDGIQEGVRILLYDRIKHLGTSYIARGYITSDEDEDIIRMHQVYHDSLKGNGFLDDIMERVKRLPRK